MDEGWIKVYRKMKEWTWFNDRYTLHLFMYLLLSVNRKDIEHNGIKIKAGSLLTNMQTLAETLDMSFNYVKRSIRNLVETGELEVEADKTNSRFRVFTIKNWSKYQFDCQPVTVTPCLSECDCHGDCQSVTGNVPYKQEEQERTLSNARANDCQPVTVTPCLSECDSQKTDSDIPTVPYNPSQGFGAPPIIPYPKTAREVIDMAALQGIAMIESDAQDFIDYNAGLGWMMNNQPIRNWTMFLKRWVERAKNYRSRSNNGNRQQQRFDTKHIPRPDEYGEGDEY